MSLNIGYLRLIVFVFIVGIVEASMGVLCFCSLIIFILIVSLYFALFEMRLWFAYLLFQRLRVFFGVCSESIKYIQHLCELGAC